MSFLCLLAAVASFVIESKTSVSMSGELPVGATATYECTYRKGQLTAGNSATLRLSGWQNTEISRVTLWMKSNQSSGAGNLQMSIDGAEVWTIPTQPFSEWAGTYSTEYVPIAHTFTPTGEVQRGEVAICVSATENSLYIERYEIEWKKAAARPYTVTLIADGQHVFSQLTETEIGIGVVLPSLSDIDVWHFCGWSEVPISETEESPTLLPGGCRYYPSLDTKLYAVYTDYQSAVLQKTQRTDCQSGYYAIVYPISQKALIGAVEEGIKGINTTDAPLIQTKDLHYERQFEIVPEMIYHVDFLPDSTAYITHVQSYTEVGYSGNTLQQNNAAWYYRLLPDSTIAFYLPRDASRSWLLTIVYDDTRLIWKGSLFSATTTLIAQQALLYEADYAAFFAHWTSFPYGQGIKPTNDKQQGKGIEIQVGTMRLLIQNGQKYLLP